VEAIEALKALLNGTPLPVHPQEMERTPASGEKALPVPPKGDYDVMQEEPPRHTGDEKENDQQGGRPENVDNIWGKW